MEAWTSSAIGQWAIGKMEEEGKAGSPNPLVHQAPAMADMPLDQQDPTAQAGMPGQDPMGMPGQDPMGMMDGNPDPMEDAPDGDSDLDDSGFPGSQEPQQGAAGESSNTPFQGNDPMTEQNKNQYSTKSAGFQNLEARLTALEVENAGLKAKLLGAERYSKLPGLKQKGVEIDIAGELARVASQTDEQFASHIEYIEKYHRRSPVAVADFSTIANVGRQGELPEESNEFDELSPADAQEVVKYAMKNEISDYSVARERYINTKKTVSNTAG